MDILMENSRVQTQSFGASGMNSKFSMEMKILSAKCYALNEVYLPAIAR